MVTTSAVAILCFLYVVNSQLIFYSTNEYQFMTHYTPLATKEVNIDSTNFYKFDWSRKAVEMTTPLHTKEEKIIFNGDSTFTLIGKSKVLDKFYLFREIFNIEDDYKITRKYKYINNTEGLNVFDSLDSCWSVLIRDNRLYLNTIFLKTI